MSDSVHFCNYAVALLDVLGQREELRQIQGIPRSKEEAEKTLEILKRTAGFVMNLRTLFAQYFEAAASPVMDVSALSREQLEEFQRHRRLDLRLLGFSDTIVIAVALRDSMATCTPINSLFATMYGVCSLSILSLSLEHALRGGLDVGPGLEIAASEVYGPALASAYTLECTHAEYPRVLVGQTLIQYLAAVVNDTGSAPHKEVSRGMANACLSFITTDTDGRSMLDFLGRTMREQASGVIPTKTIQDLHSFVVREQARFGAAGDVKLSERYGRLRRYVESRLPLWTATPLPG